MHYTISDYILDISQNAIEAGSNDTELSIYQTPSSLSVTVADTGCGMDPSVVRRAEDPFFTDGTKHPGRRVGLGIPFLTQLLAQTGGEWRVDSRPGLGTTVWFRFNLDHVDTPPLGDLVMTLVQLYTFEGCYELIVRRHKVDPGGNQCSYMLRRSELADALGDLESVASIGLLRDFIASQEASESFC
ncbi:ATP-binding protein [Salinispira pacifica]